MRNKNEIILGIIGVCTVLVLIWGINYLKGRNILQSTYALHSFYKESGGLQESAPVLFRGIKIGYVDQVILHPALKTPIEVVLMVEKEYSLPMDSHAILGSTDLLGTKAIFIEPGISDRRLQSEDTLHSSVREDMADRLEQELVPVLENIGSLAVSLDTLSQELRGLLAGEELSTILQHLSLASSELHQGLDNLESFTAMMKANENEIEEMLNHLQAFSLDLDRAGLDTLAMEFKGVATKMNSLLAYINSGEGNAGRFIYSDSLYSHLNTLVKNLDVLVKDLNEHPEDYVQISVFGRSGKKKDIP